MRKPYIVKLVAQNRPWQIEKAPFDPEGINDRLELVAESPAQTKPLTVQDPRQRSERRRPDAENASAPRPNRPTIAEVKYASEPVKTPTVVELRQKAQQCRIEAESYTIPDLRAQLLEIASEYDRLATRGEQFEERARLPKLSPMNTVALTNWFT